jgi:hypothetical protein
LTAITLIDSTIKTPARVADRGQVLVITKNLIAATVNDASTFDSMAVRFDSTILTFDEAA